MDSKIIKFEGLNIDSFVSFVNSIDINKLPFAIEIKKSKITSKVHPNEKTFLKYLSVDINTIFDKIELTNEVNYIRFNAVSVKKLKEGLSVYKKAEIKKINGEFNVSFDEANDESWRTNYIKLKSKNINLKINGHESHKVPFLPDDIWTDKLFDISNYNLKFDIDLQSIKNMLRLIGFEKDTSDKATSIYKSILDYDSKNKKLVFRSKDDKWEIKYNPDNEQALGEYDFKSNDDYTYAIQEIVLKLLNAPKYTVYLVTNNNMNKPLNLIFFVNGDNDVIMSAAATVNR